MSPVRQSNPRTLVLAIGGAVIGTVLVLLLVVFAVGQASQSGKVEVKLGTERFQAGDATNLAAAVGRDGPLLFSDVATGQRDIYLQHRGEEVAKGWIAFDARRAEQPRSCTLRWDRATSTFLDPCGGPAVPADGAGLVHYPVEVDADSRVIVDLNADKRRAATTASTPTTEQQLPDQAPSSLVITGSTPR